jgi:hypothetical protein
MALLSCQASGPGFDTAASSLVSDASIWSRAIRTRSAVIPHASGERRHFLRLLLSTATSPRKRWTAGKKFAEAALLPMSAARWPK